MTDQEEKALLWDKEQRGLELKKTVAAIGTQLSQYAVEWRKLGDMLGDFDHYTFRSDGTSIQVLNPKQEQMGRLGVQIPGIKPGSIVNYHTVASVGVSWFNSGALIQLLKELEDAKEELAGIREFFRKIGDPLENY
jgi:hypothetical protein